MKITIQFLVFGLALLVLTSCAVPSRPNPAGDAIATMMLQPVE